MKKFSLTVLAGAIFATGAIASEVTPQHVTTFSAGTAAVASEVNGNFAALIAAINDNATRLDEVTSNLEDATTRLATIEAEAALTLSQRIAGSHYKLLYNGIGYFGDKGTQQINGKTGFENSVNFSLYTGDSDITFDANGTFAETNLFETDAHGAVALSNCEHFPSTRCNNGLEEGLFGPDAINGLWSVNDSTGTVSITFSESDGDVTLVFVASETGEVLFYQEFINDADSDAFGTQQLLEINEAVLVRLP